MVISRAHKKRVEDWLHSVFIGAGFDAGARDLARQVILLLDGGFAVVLLHRDPSYLETAGDAAARLIRAHERRCGQSIIRVPTTSDETSKR